MVRQLTSHLFLKCLSKLNNDSGEIHMGLFSTNTKLSEQTPTEKVERVLPANLILVEKFEPAVKSNFLPGVN